MPAYASSAVATQTVSSALRQVSAAKGRVVLVMVSPFASAEAGVMAAGNAAADEKIGVGRWGFCGAWSLLERRPRTRRPDGKDRFLMRDRLGHTIGNA